MGGEERGGEGKEREALRGKERRERGKRVRERSQSKVSGGRIKTCFGNHFTHNSTVSIFSSIFRKATTKYIELNNFIF